MYKIEGIDFQQLESEKFWSFPASYSDDRKKQETMNIIYSDQYLAAEKKDGFYYRFVKGMNGDMVLQGRNKNTQGIYLDKYAHVPHLHEFFEALPNGTVLLGEGHIPSKPGSKNVTSIMNCLLPKSLSRQEEDDSKLHYWIFDVLAFAGKSLLETQMRDRIQYFDQLPTSPYAEAATYWNQGDDIWNHYQQILQADGEGIVLTRRDSLPQPGKRPARKTLKLKKELRETIDVIIIGANAPTREYTGKEIATWSYFYNPKTGEKIEGQYGADYAAGRTTLVPVTRSFFQNMAGSLKIGLRKNGQVVQVGSISGLEDEILLNWKDYLGKVAEITAMEIDFEGQSFRHPRFVSWREDLVPEDCDWDKVFVKRF